MHIPALYDALWVILPTTAAIMLGVVLCVELRYRSSAARTIAWSAVQVFLPFIGFVAWLVLELPRLKRTQQDG